MNRHTEHAAALASPGTAAQPDERSNMEKLLDRINSLENPSAVCDLLLAMAPMIREMRKNGHDEEELHP